jgi:pimeloyl-ACP methyl ester carboxylesterase
MDQAVTGLLALLDAEQVPTAHVVGSSLGGMIAQCLVRRAPERVASLVLATTGAPAPAFARSLARRWRMLLALLPWLPKPVIQQLNGWRFARLLAGAETDPTFWRAYFREILTRYTPKAWYTSSTRLLLDFLEHDAFAPGDLAGWPGRILILEADNDSEIAAPMRHALKVAYPQAMISTFHGAGHLALVTRAAEYLATVRSFLDLAAGQPAPAAAQRPPTGAAPLHA